MNESSLQITSRNLTLTEPLQKEIRKKASKLERVYDRITRCKVVIESPHRKQHQVKEFNVSISMSVPGAELIVKKQTRDDLYIAIRDSFNAARRKLEEYSRKQRGDVKQHEEVPLARISSLFPGLGYGFLTTFDNQEVYFHENSVTNLKFDNLEKGMEVRFVAENGDKGPQARSITVLTAQRV
jgi:ribosomal subunit interface protein